MLKLEHWLPADTRVVEMASAGGLMAASKFLLFGFLEIAGSNQPPKVLAVMFACVGILQLIGALKELAPLRVITGLLAGMLWIWSGIRGDGQTVHLNDIVSWFLGASCMYVFVLHSLHATKEERERG